MRSETARMYFVDVVENVYDDDGNLIEEGNVTLSITMPDGSEMDIVVPACAVRQLSDALK